MAIQAGATAAESLAAGLPRLLLEAERLAHAASPGMHGRRRTGPGENFWQFRDFRNGDDSRRIDWRRSAGADRFYLREREWEAQASIALRLHDSPGMTYRSHANLPPKRDRAVLLLLALASLLLRAGERVALADMTPPLTGNSALHKLAAALLNVATQPEAAQPASPPVDPKARVIAFGDFLEPEPVFSARPGGAVVQILDPAECDFPFTGRIIFEGFSSEPEIEAANAEAWGAAYRARIIAQREAVIQAAQCAGQTALFHRTDLPTAAALAAIYHALAAGRTTAGSAP
jgi:uncharacterized protein (DUF58 family)